MPAAALFLAAFHAPSMDQIKHPQHQRAARAATPTKVPDSRKSRTLWSRPLLMRKPSLSGSQVVPARTAMRHSIDSDSDSDQPLSVKGKQAQAEQQPQLPIRLLREMGQKQESSRRPHRVTERALDHVL